jgi:hypothetical protein
MEKSGSLLENYLLSKLYLEDKDDKEAYKQLPLSRKSSQKSQMSQNDKTIVPSRKSSLRTLVGQAKPVRSDSSDSLRTLVGQAKPALVGQAKPVRSDSSDSLRTLVGQAKPVRSDSSDSLRTLVGQAKPVRSDSSEFKVDKQLYGKEKEYLKVKNELSELLKLKINVELLQDKKKVLLKTVFEKEKLLKKECSKISISEKYNDTVCPIYVGKVKGSNSLLVRTMSKISPNSVLSSGTLRTLKSKPNKSVVISEDNLDDIMSSINKYHSEIQDIKEILDHIETMERKWDENEVKYEHLKKKLFSYGK